MAAANIMQISFFIFDSPTFQAASAAIIPVITESDFQKIYSVPQRTAYHSNAPDNSLHLPGSFFFLFGLNVILSYLSVHLKAEQKNRQTGKAVI
jgi:hypothetical protein